MEKKSLSDSALDKKTKFILQDTGQRQTPRTTGNFQEPNWENLMIWHPATGYIDKEKGRLR